MTEQLHFHFSFSCIGKGNGNPLQCSCLENPRDGEAWWATVYGVAQSWTRLTWLSSSSRLIIAFLPRIHLDPDSQVLGRSYPQLATCCIVWGSCENSFLHDASVSDKFPPSDAQDSLTLLWFLISQTLWDEGHAEIYLLEKLLNPFYKQGSSAFTLTFCHIGLYKSSLKGKGEIHRYWRVQWVPYMGIVYEFFWSDPKVQESLWLQ